MTKDTAAILLIILVLTIVVLYPLAVIWSVNVLFGTSIAYGFYEWLATLVLVGVVQGNRTWRT